VTLCSVVGGYHCFRWPSCIHLQGEHWYPMTPLHGVTIKKKTWIFIAMQTSNLAPQTFLLLWFTKQLSHWHHFDISS